MELNGKIIYQLGKGIQSGHTGDLHLAAFVIRRENGDTGGVSRQFE